ncbi:SLAP domain-containing protein [Lactobacillus gallinarum]|uniref:SLAP domain-containing protein n=1 Tax=Lactobacillus gallinarum TaxID=52242 RepID=UPI0025A4A599|nr:SLAP domain-containing protein [Lactobacillus gallinarum]MDM8277094.1 SLAP domain-containing protein [Lactobacillus gallinarum]
MKKNLRIVSAAAAALLAVAPVAASAVSTVNADSVQSVTQLGKVPAFANGSTVNVKPNITLNTAVGNSVAATISASFEVTVNGTTATSNFKPDASTVTLKDSKGNKVEPDEFNKKVSQAVAGEKFTVTLTDVGLNFGSQNANKEITLTMPEGDFFQLASNNTVTNSRTIKLDQNGTVTLNQVAINVTAKDFANPAVVAWYDRETNVNVTSGNITLDAGKMNVAQFVAAAENKYVARNNAGDKYNSQSSTISYSNNIKEALKAMNIDVDANGWFVAPKSFTFEMTASANNNDASAKLPITVTVPNGKDVTPATVPSQSKTIMHNAYSYDKDAKRVGTDKVTRYNTVTVAMNTTKLANGISYYEVIENGKATGKYINADNIDGTKRTLKHNAYVYKTSKKRANKVVLKKGTEVTTYGGAYTFKNGKKYYKIGADTKKTYVKVANFE